MCGLALLLVAQLGWSHWSRFLVRVEPISVGTRLALPVKPLGGYRHSGLACRVAFIVDPNCPYSRILAQQIGTTRPPRDITPLWISVGSEAETRAFADDLGLPDMLWFETAGELSANALLAKLDVPVTPTRIVFGAQQEVVDMQITWSLELPTSTDSTCTYSQVAAR